MSHEMNDLKHNDTFKREHALYKTGDADAPEAIKDRNGEVVLGLCKICDKAEVELSEQCFFDSRPNRDMAVIEASGLQGCGKSLLVKILAAALSAVGIKSISGEDAGPDNIGQHHLVIDTSNKKALANLELTIQRSGLKDFEAMAIELKEARGERDAWKRVAERAGVCMTCALGHAALDNGTPGCTDCLNSGWEHGAPTGFVPDNGPEVMQFTREQGVKVVNTRGKRWRLQGPGWIMQPEGHVSADQAREICEMAFLAFAPQRRVTPEEDSLAHVRGDTVIDRPNPMIEAGRERAKRCSSEHCKDGYCMNWHAPHACYVKDETVIDRPAYKKPQPETLTEARLARLERFFTTEAGDCFSGPLYELFNERVEAARKREA